METKLPQRYELYVADPDESCNSDLPTPCTAGCQCSRCTGAIWSPPVESQSDDSQLPRISDLVEKPLFQQIQQAPLVRLNEQHSIAAPVVPSFEPLSRRRIAEEDQSHLRSVRAEPSRSKVDDYHPITEVLLDEATDILRSKLHFSVEFGMLGFDSSSDSNQSQLAWLDADLVKNNLFLNWELLAV